MDLGNGHLWTEAISLTPESSTAVHCRPILPLALPATVPGLELKLPARIILNMLCHPWIPAELFFYISAVQESSTQKNSQALQ